MRFRTGLIPLAALACAVLLLAASQSTLAADGEALYKQKLCVTCHGAEGKAPITDTYPRLAGQNEAYLVRQIKDIKSGARSNGQAAVMRSMVQKLSDAEIEAIAAYLSSRE